MVFVVLFVIKGNFGSFHPVVILISEQETFLLVNIKFYPLSTLGFKNKWYNKMKQIQPQLLPFTKLMEGSIILKVLGVSEYKVETHVLINV